MIRHIDIDVLKNRIMNLSIRFGGHAKLKIYGMLDCSSGKRMKRENRVFFVSEQEAIEAGFHPCCHCMKEEYRAWISLNR